MIFSMALESANRSLTPNELLRGLQRVGQLPETTEGQRIGNQINAAPIPEKFSALLSRVA
jgi:hypothetical protein